MTTPLSTAPLANSPLLNTPLSNTPLGTPDGSTIRPVFSLNIANPQGTESRAPGDCYAWNGSVFKRFTDPNAPITIGVPDSGVLDTPTAKVGAATVYPLYPEWTLNKSVVAGEKVWLNKLNGENKVVEFTQPLTLPNKWEANPATYVERDNYIPQLGAYFEPDTAQLLSNAADGTWGYTAPNAVPTGTFVTNLIEDAPDVEWIACDEGDPTCVQFDDTPVSTGDVLTFSVLFQIHPDDRAKFRRVILSARGAVSSATNPNGGYQINDDGSVSNTVNGAKNHVIWIDSNTFLAYVELEPLINNDTRVRLDVICYPQPGQGPVRVATHCKNGYIGQYEAQPIPAKATRPANSALVVGNAQDLWLDPGMNDDGVLLFGTDYTGFENGKTVSSHLYTCANGDGLIMYLQGGVNTLQVSSFLGGEVIEPTHPLDQQLPFTAKYTNTLATPVFAMRSLQAGERTAVNDSSTLYSARTLSGDMQINGNAPITAGAVRMLVYWNDSTVISDAEFDDIFDPGRPPA